ncbi:hypothetical protein KFQ04_22115 [Pseudomonas synxantha]|nr:hypothetical protein KFQ04_22115 [Pseudomonas synxantha]
MFGAFDIDNAVNPSFKKNYTYIPQVSNNVEGALAEEVKYFAADFLNFRSIAPNLHEVMLNKNGSVGDIKLSWSSSDNMMKKIMNYSSKNQSKIHYRIGRSLNGGPIKPERIDLYIYVVKQIVDRYTNRWKEIGLPRPVEEYAIWNEPDLPFFFTGQNPRDPRTEYFNMYLLLAKAVKEMAPSALVGGPGVATYSSEMFLERFLRYCSETNAPLDFFHDSKLFN